MKGNEHPPALAWIVVAIALGLCLGGCRSLAPPEHLVGTELDTAVAALTRPLPGAMAALYRLRVPSSGGLRLSVLERSGAGRLNVSEPFGSLLSITAWSESAPSRVFDMREPCQVETDGFSGILGMHSLPVAQAVRLLAGRLPALAEDSITESSEGGLMVGGSGWSCAVFLARDPWRVIAVADRSQAGEPRWRLELDKHSGPVPGLLRFEHADGRWAELELSKLQWDSRGELPALPEVPPCAP